jgi:hypothetical protein
MTWTKTVTTQRAIAQCAAGVDGGAAAPGRASVSDTTPMPWQPCRCWPIGSKPLLPVERGVVGQRSISCPSRSTQKMVSGVAGYPATGRLLKSSAEGPGGIPTWDHEIRFCRYCSPRDVPPTTCADRALIIDSDTIEQEVNRIVLDLWGRLPEVVRTVVAYRLKGVKLLPRPSKRGDMGGLGWLIGKTHRVLQRRLMKKHIES